MKWVKKTGLLLLFFPMLLIAVFVFYEILGMCVNHAAARRQTDTLLIHLENEISDLEIIEVSSETGNTSGTGNHVDCLTAVTFSTGMEGREIEKKMAGYYTFDGWSCCLKETEEGVYLFYLNRPAPFEDNIEGH